jgi:hypothetical protein
MPEPAGGEVIAATEAFGRPYAAVRLPGGEIVLAIGEAGAPGWVRGGAVVLEQRADGTANAVEAGG